MLLLCLVGTVGSLWLSLRSSKVQTALVGYMTEVLSDGLGADVSVGQVEIAFFNRLRLTDIYLGDRTGDTLAYVPQIEVRFNPIAIQDNRLDFPLVDIDRPYFNLKQDSTGTNLDFLIRAFQQEDTVHREFPFTLNIDDIRLTDARIRYRHAPSGTDVLLSRMSARMALPQLSSDTLEAELLGLRLRADWLNKDISFDGAFRGSRDSVVAEDLLVRFRGEQLLSGDVAIWHPLEKDKMRLRADLKDLYATHSLLQDLIAGLTMQPITLPREIARLGEMHYQGLVDGGLDSLTLHGAFRTRLGTVTTNGGLQVSEDFRRLCFNGEVQTRRFNVGRMAGTSELGYVSLNAYANGIWQSGEPLQLTTRAKIIAADVHHYTYHNIRIDGSLADSVFTGEIVARDPALSFDFSGIMDFSSVDPAHNLRLVVEHMKLAEMGVLSKDKYKHQDLSFTVDLSLNTDGDEKLAVDRLNGYLIIDSLLFAANGLDYNLKQFKLLFETGSDFDNVRISSDVMTAGMSGSWRWSTLGRTLQGFGHSLLPEFVEPVPEVNEEPNNLDFYAYFHDLDPIMEVVLLSNVIINDNQIIKGFIHETDGTFGLQAFVPSVENGNSEYQDLTFSVSNVPGEADLSLKVRSHTINPDSTQLMIGDVDMHLSVQARNDSLLLGLFFGNQVEPAVRIHTHLTRYASKPHIDVHMLPTTFQLNDTTWYIGDGHVEYNAYHHHLSVQNVSLYSLNQHIHANGTAGLSDDDSLRIDLRNIELNYLLQFVGVSRSLSVVGQVTGWMTLYSLFTDPYFEANVNIPHAVLNHTDMGALAAQATIDRETKHVLINGDLVENNRLVGHVDGNVIPSEKYWELYITTDSANIAMINFWTQGMIEQIQGRAFGQIHVFGRKMDTWVTAKALAKDASLVIPYTGVRYYLSDSVIMDTTYISFPHVVIRDEDGHEGMVTGMLEHDRFNDFKFHITGVIDNIQAINLAPDPETMYYGKAYASGRIDISGDDDNVLIDISAVTRRNTDFYLSIATASSASDNGFIRFVTPEPNRVVVSNRSRRQQQQKKVVKRGAKLTLNMAMEATPDARLHLLLSDHSSDGIVCRGEGNLKLSFSGDEDIRLIGTYTLLSGTFSYSLGNIVHRDFVIAEGSSITWNNAPEEPILNVTARYRTTASLKDLFGEEAAMITSRSSVPVNCVLMLSGKLSDPILRFAIELPQSDESVEAQVRAAINTEEMLMRQVIYLLVFNRFFTPEYLATNATGTGLNATYSLLSSTVTGQINAWLSRLTDVFTVGFNFRTDGEGSNATQEYEAQFQLNPVERLTINGNIGYRYNDISARSPVFGDVDVEYGLIPSGKLRAKAFTHTVDKYSLREANTVQGVGLIFRHDYNWGDARKHAMMRKARKAREKQKANTSGIQAVQTDSVPPVPETPDKP